MGVWQTPINLMTCGRRTINNLERTKKSNLVEFMTTSTYLIGRMLNTQTSDSSIHRLHTQNKKITEENISYEKCETI